MVREDALLIWHFPRVLVRPLARSLVPEATACQVGKDASKRRPFGQSQPITISEESRDADFGLRENGKASSGPTS